MRLLSEQQRTPQSAAALREDLLSRSEPGRLRAAYELSRRAEGVSVLLEVLSFPHVSTSVRRTAAYGVIASRVSADQWGTLLPGSGADGPAAIHGTAKVLHTQSSTGVDGDDHHARAAGSAATVGPPIHTGDCMRHVVHRCQLLGLGDGEWMTASAIRTIDGFDSEMLLAATGNH